MKRNINLQSLSRDHHHGLLLGWKIRQGLKFLVNPALIVEYVNYFSTTALFPHFEEEERWILHYLPDNDDLKQRTLQEHSTIVNLIHSLGETNEADPVMLLKIAELLDGHIRFEERELFPYMENVLSDEQLNEIGVAIDSNHIPFEDSFPHEFWKGHID